MQAPKEKKYTEGKLISALVSLAFPIILANVLQTAYQLIDTFWLGRLGANAVAAVSVSFPILFLILSVGAGLTLAGTVLVSQHKGANNQKMVNSASSQTVFVVFSISVLLAIVGYFAAGPLMKVIGAGPEIYSDSVDYFKVSSLGFVFLFMFFVFQSLMRGIGNVKLPVYVVLVTVLLNLVLDPLFIYGFGPVPGFGVAGAAVASVITQGLSAIAGIYIMWRGKHGIQIHFSEMKWDPPWAKKLFQLGFPSSMEQSARALGMIMMVMLVTSFGSETVAAYGVGARMLSFVIVPALGLAIATTTLVGQNVGARKLKRAEKTGLLSIKVAFFGLTGIGILLFLFAEDLVRFFVPNEPNVIADGALFIKIMGPSFGFLGVQQVVNGTFNGAGFTKASMFISFLNLWIIRFPVGYYLAYHTSLGHEGIYWAFPISNWVSAIVAFIYFKTGYWRKRLES
ncbi:MATE family efflux transporter [Echinicola strongylocentroti]|uniref:Multidrug-efflux transporter n=1 Tax=Echinicola strongylocentroti TaxID=1795355 RepID=A0A2Z4IJQ4_9BACT|nr:MATE family efflux transporter [Echinicola strongylocentroti]AWW30633.1 MATE family efflux transporter [Echinicola strongylocentroti]